MKHILEGRKPSEIFSERLAASDGPTRSALYIEFANTFPGVDGVAFNVICNFQRPGMDDATFDLEIEEILRDSGYLKAGSSNT